MLQHSSQNTTQRHVTNLQINPKINPMLTKTCRWRQRRGREWWWRQRQSPKKNTNGSCSVRERVSWRHTRNATCFVRETKSRQNTRNGQLLQEKKSWHSMREKELRHSMREKESRHYVRELEFRRQWITSIELFNPKLKFKCFATLDYTHCYMYFLFPPHRNVWLWSGCIDTWRC